MGMRMSKPWVELTPETISALPAQLGVYEVSQDRSATPDGPKTHRIGFAGGTEPFGMRTALERERDDGATFFRHEFTHAYMTRGQELLMIFEADHGRLPPGNQRPAKLGRLSPLGIERAS